MDWDCSELPKQVSSPKPPVHGAKQKGGTSPLQGPSKANFQSHPQETATRSANNSKTLSRVARLTLAVGIQIYI